MPDEFERLVPEFIALARRIFDAGGKAEHSRLMALLQYPDGSASASNQTSQKPRARSATYGSVSAPVRDALNELSTDSPEGVAVADIVAYFELRGSGPTEKQIRAALKQLTNTREAIRIDRGKYLSREAHESRNAEKPGGDTPGSFDLAAE
jgi:hypothetical protein